MTPAAARSSSLNLDTEAIIGSVSYHQAVYGPNEGSRPYNIGITLAPEQRGKGYGVEAQRLLLQDGQIFMDLLPLSASGAKHQSSVSDLDLAKSGSVCVPREESLD